ncbi:MAG: hypothetical protein AB7N91_01375 [Candidatus Tectimicrobiota bacterium]
MAEVKRWHKYQETQAFLVALDISGFSRHMDKMDQLLAHRNSFFEAVKTTTLFDQAKTAGTVVTHFLGDELRLAFYDAVGAQAVRNFVEAVLQSLMHMNRMLTPERQTRVKGVVFAGVVIWKEWQGCPYLDGQLPYQAQHCIDLLNPGQVAMNSAFKQALESEAVPTGTMAERQCLDEPVYILYEEEGQ